MARPVIAPVAQSHPTWRVVAGDMTWPLPDDGMDELEWRLRYTNVAKTDQLVAASIVSAYRELVRCNRVKRELVVRELKAG